MNKEFWTLFSVVRVETSGSMVGVSRRFIDTGIPRPTEHIEIIHDIALVVTAVACVSSTPSQVVLVVVIAQLTEDRPGSIASPPQSGAAGSICTALALDGLLGWILSLLLIAARMCFLAFSDSAHRTRISNLIMAGQGRKPSRRIVRGLLLGACVRPPSSQVGIAPRPLHVVGYCNIAGRGQSADADRPCPDLVL